MEHYLEVNRDNWQLWKKKKFLDERIKTSLILKKKMVEWIFSGWRGGSVYCYLSKIV